jgi:hypothetical protein
MSITASYLRVSPGEFQRFLNDPKAAAAFELVDMDHMELLDDLNEAAITRLEESNNYLDIDRDWHALHFLLTGKAEMDGTSVPPPLGNVVLGGTDTKWEATYGMVRSLTPEEVKDVARALEEIKEDDLRRLDLGTFTAIDLYSYHESWSVEDLERLVNVFAQVRDFFAVAAHEGDIVLLSSN